MSDVTGSPRFNGPLIAHLRQLHGVTPKEMAAFLGCSVSHLNNVEKARKGHPLSEEKARRMARLFGITDLRVLYGPAEMPEAGEPVFDRVQTQ